MKRFLKIFLLFFSFQSQGQTGFKYFTVDSLGLLRYKIIYNRNGCDTICSRFERMVNKKWESIDGHGDVYGCSIPEGPCQTFPVQLVHDSASCYVQIFNGENKFRMSMTSPIKAISKEVMVIGKPQKCKFNISGQFMYLEQYSEFFIYDINNSLIKQDSGKAINITVFKKGIYYIYKTNTHCMCEFGNK